MASGTFTKRVHFEAREIARCCEANPGVPDIAITTFIAGYGWQLMPKLSGGHVEWYRPDSGARAQRVDALGVCLAAYRQRTHEWPPAFERCWRERDLQSDVG
jgi:hypothetical protein